MIQNEKIINQQLQQLYHVETRTFLPQSKDRKGKKLDRKKIKNFFFSFFQFFSIFCLLVTSEMTCIHNLEVLTITLGHFWGKNFDHVFEIFGSGPKSHFGQKMQKNWKNWKKNFTNFLALSRRFQRVQKLAQYPQKCPQKSKFSFLKT